MAKLQKFSAVARDGCCPCGYPVLYNANPLGGRGFIRDRLGLLYILSKRAARRSALLSFILAAPLLVMRAVRSFRSNQIRCGRCGVRYLK